jgi:3'(2'), 5'-bisphosphate nucleotidase
MSTEWRTTLAALASISDAAGAAILEIYRGPLAATYKDDASPLTAADLASHRLIRDRLSALDPSTPQLSEEDATLKPGAWRGWPRFWLIDPLDGTKEFLKRNDEFTINIALIVDGEPSASVVAAPALGEMLLAARGHGVWRWRDGALESVVRPVRAPNQLLRVAASRSHPDSRLAAWLERIGRHQVIHAGSALKFLRIASGAADVYPRFGLTSEWDTAAGQLLVEEAGGRVVDAHRQSLRYGARDTLLNPDFVAIAGDLPPLSFGL